MGVFSAQSDRRCHNSVRWTNLKMKMKCMIVVCAIFLLEIARTCAQPVDLSPDQNFLHPNILVILKEPYYLKVRLDSVIQALENNPNGHEGAGKTPGSISEAADFIEHSTHMMEPLRHGID